MFEAVVEEVSLQLGAVSVLAAYQKLLLQTGNLEYRRNRPRWMDCIHCKTLLYNNGKSDIKVAAFAVWRAVCSFFPHLFCIDDRSGSVLAVYGQMTFRCEKKVAIE